MAQLIPESWRQGLAHLRDDIHDAIDRWWHHRHHEMEPGTAVPVRRVTPERVEDNAWPLSSPSFLGPHLPLVDVEETEDDVLVTAELPGLEKDDFTVDISGARLRIRGEKKQSSERKTRGAYYAECSYGAFSRAILLPCEIDADHAKAAYEHGTLRMTLPKTDRAKASRIKVQVHD